MCTMHLLLNYSEQWGYFCKAFQWSTWEEEVWSTCFLHRRRYKANPKGRQKWALCVGFFFLFSASPSNMPKKNILCVISDDYIHKSQPRKNIPVLGINHLQSKTYFMPLSWVPFLPWALGKRRKLHNSDCFMFSRCFFERECFLSFIESLK